MKCKYCKTSFKQPITLEERDYCRSCDINRGALKVCADMIGFSPTGRPSRQFWADKLTQLL
jgi:hypothetical protein